MILSPGGLLGLFLLLAVAVIGAVATANHWVVTENGRIQSTPESVFQMRNPDDLLWFLEQENRRDSMERLMQSMINRSAKIDNQFYHLRSIKDVNNLKITDNDCLSKDHYDTDVDFHQTAIVDISCRENIKIEDYLLDDIDQKVPDCKNTFSLDFSMHTFEHLSAMRDRKKLNLKMELELLKYIPSSVDINSFGYKVANGLKENKTSWVHLHLASLYWRINGDAYNALECTRRAIVKAPRQYRDIPLLTTGGIFHAANYSKEAAIVLLNAIEYAPTESLHHFMLANVYAHLLDYNKSIEYYDNALKYNPNLDAAKKAKHGILCGLKLESSLSTLYQQLLDVLNEIRAFYNEQTEYLNHREKIGSRSLQSSEEIMISPQEELNYEALDALLTHHGQTCVQRSVDEPILSCDFTTEKKTIAHQLQLDYGISLQILKTIEVQAKEIRSKMLKAKFLIEDLEHLTNQLPDYSKFSTVFMEPTGRPKYHNFEIKKSKEPFEKKDWPGESYCKSLIPFVIDVKQYVPVYLPPENKGYVTYLFVSELIGLDPGKEHPRPWRLPLCHGSKSFNRKYIPPELVKATTGYNLPDTGLTPILTALVQNADVSEIGQRILTAMNSKVASPWVLSMLASLHWRVVGKPRNALDCLQLALDTVPKKFKDVPLISIASISHKFSLIDNALFVTKDAYKINPVEPTTNFLYGTLLHIKGNYSGAIFHLKQALRVDPAAADGRAFTMLQTIACQEKFSSTPSPGFENKPLGFQMIYCVDQPSDHCHPNDKNCERFKCFEVNNQADLDLLAKTYHEEPR